MESSQESTFISARLHISSPAQTAAIGKFGRMGADDSLGCAARLFQQLGNRLWSSSVDSGRYVGSSFALLVHQARIRTTVQ